MRRPRPFLAYSRCRLSEARAATWGDVDLTKGLLTVHNAKVRRARNWKPTRVVPVIPDMRKLLERLKADKPKATDPICKVGDCEKSLVRACKLAGVARLTHHDLRHLFGTRCIEAGVDIPTVSRWLCHSDGGALAMRVYGHLREKHSQAMAAKVTFGQSQPENVLTLPQDRNGISQIATNCAPLMPVGTRGFSLAFAGGQTGARANVKSYLGTSCPSDLAARMTRTILGA